MSNTLLLIGIISISLLAFHITNCTLLRNELRKYTNEYKNYFYTEHINRHPFLYIFFTMFILMYNSRHKEDFELGYLKYKVKKIDNIRNNTNQFNYIGTIDIGIEGEDELRKKLHQYELKMKLKILNKQKKQ